MAADFFTVEAWTREGLTRFLVLFLIDLSTRRVEIAGLAKRANGLWMSQVARNLSDAAEGFLVGKRYLIHDRDPLFTAEFLETLGTSGVKSVKLPPRSPNLNAHAERFVRTNRWAKQARPMKYPVICRLPRTTLCWSRARGDFPRPLFL